MKKIVTLVAALLLVSATAALAAGPGPFHAMGDYCAQGWSSGPSNLLTLAGGIWSGDVVAPAAGNFQGKVGAFDWSESYPNSNQTVFVGTAGELIHWTFDTNTYSDGWSPSTNIVMNDHIIPAGTTFEAIGSAPETGSWASGAAATLTGDVWSVQLVIATAATYDVKFRKTGDWGLNVGADGVGTNANNYSYTTTVANQPVLFEFNQRTGRMRVVVGGVTPTHNETWGQLKATYR